VLRSFVDPLCVELAEDALTREAGALTLRLVDRKHVDAACRFRVPMSYGESVSCAFR
jgi:hypothetical protein